MKRMMLFITIIILIFCITACDGHYGGYDLEAYSSSKDLNITKIVVRVHTKDDVCCVNLICYEFENFDGNEINVYFPQEVTIIENSKKYPVRHFGGQGITDQSVMLIYTEREFDLEEFQNLKINVHLGNVSVYPVHKPKIEINGYRISEENLFYINY